jgi:hypothetical protein
MVGSEFPHPNGTSPNTISMLKTRSGLSAQDFDSLLGSTAAEFFDLTVACKEPLPPLSRRREKITWRDCHS